MIAKELLNHIEGVGLFSIISLLMFFSMFALVLANTYSIKKDEAKKLSSIPFDNSNENENV